MYIQIIFNKQVDCTHGWIKTWMYLCPGAALGRWQVRACWRLWRWWSGPWKHSAHFWRGWWWCRWSPLGQKLWWSTGWSPGLVVGWHTSRSWGLKEKGFNAKCYTTVLKVLFSVPQIQHFCYLGFQEILKLSHQSFIAISLKKIIVDLYVFHHFIKCVCTNVSRISSLRTNGRIQPPWFLPA